MPLFNDEASLIPSPHPGFISGKYYASTIYSATTNLSFSIGFVYYIYFFVSFQQSFSKVAFYSNTSFSNTQNVRLGIYKIAFGLPSTLVADLGSISFTSNGSKEVACSIVLPAGWYSIGFITNPSFINLLCPLITLTNLLGTASLGSSTSGFRATLAYGDFPSVASLTNLTEVSVPIIWLKAS
ncbi:MAG: hypothetical protein KME31_33160 [Tolypothrix carrinoi HA7290-LM1]|jgi:hypothetical protein|nr:hypothetical protein [Tolypothrix carrinoi HA7290-LM1]